MEPCRVATAPVSAGTPRAVVGASIFAVRISMPFRPFPLRIRERSSVYARTAARSGPSWQKMNRSRSELHSRLPSQIPVGS